MFLGRVAGTVWSTVKWPQARGSSCCSCGPYRLGDLPPGASAGGPRGRRRGAASEPTDDLVVCADMLDAGPGDDVMVAFGHAARVAISDKLPPGTKPKVPIDAAVVAVVDRVDCSAVVNRDADAAPAGRRGDPRGGGRRRRAGRRRAGCVGARATADRARRRAARSSPRPARTSAASSPRSRRRSPTPAATSSTSRRRWSRTTSR